MEPLKFILSLLAVLTSASFNQYAESNVQVSDNVTNFVSKRRAAQNDISNESLAPLSIGDGANITTYDVASKNINTEFFNPFSYEYRPLNVSDGDLALASSYDEPDNNIYFDGTSYYTKPYIPKTMATHESFSTRAIIGNDERDRITNTSDSPYCMTGKIVVIYENVYNNVEKKYEDPGFVGTGFLVGESVIASAGHVFYGDVTKSNSYEDNIDNPRFPDRAYIVFGANGERDMNDTSNVWRVNIKKISIQEEYYKNKDSKYDWAVCTLDRPVGHLLGYNGMKTNWKVQNGSIDTIGYPGDKAEGTMWHSSGNIISYDDYNYHTNIDSCGGQSGSAYFSDNYSYVVGIHTFGNKKEQYNGGTILNTLIFNFIQSYSRSLNPCVRIEKLSKNGRTWNVTIKNITSKGITVFYNKKMCNSGDAIVWSGLKDVAEINLSAKGTANVSIDENWFATHIVFSFISEQSGKKYRLITYAWELNANGTFKEDYSVVEA